jgi:protein-disulfide isomerase
MDKRFAAILAAIVIIFAGIVLVGRNNDKGAEGASNTKAQATNHVKGEGSKGVTLVEYGDFQCPVCAAYEPAVRQVYEKYKDDIKIQFRHFPLQSIHENALAGSRAAEAAGLQGKFWEMHDLLYDNQQSWAKSGSPQTFFEQYAQQVGVNVDQYKKDFASSKVNDTVNADMAEGTKLKITGTPAFFIDGKEIPNTDVSTENRPDLEKFSKIIDDAIKAKQDK